MKPRACPVCGTARPQPSRRQRWEWLVGFLLPWRPYRCQSCPVRYWSWTPRFFTAARSAVWLLLAFVAYAAVRAGAPPVPAAAAVADAQPPAPSSPPATVGPEAPVATAAANSEAAPAEDPLVERLAEAERERLRLTAALDASTDEQARLSAELENAVRDGAAAAARVAALETELRQARAAAAAPPAAEVTDGAAPAAREEQEAVIAAVEAWARAWSDQRYDDYVAAYAVDYAPPGSTRGEWLELRRERLLSPSRIELLLARPTLDFPAAGRATAEFRQRYAADSFSDVVVKRLTFALEGDGWKIIDERVLAP